MKEKEYLCNSEVIKGTGKYGFTIVDNTQLRDKRLSGKERGIFTTMLSFPKGWHYSIKGLAAVLPDGVESIRRSLNKLESCGYINRTKARAKVKGREVNGYFYQIIESPEEYINKSFSESDNQSQIPRARFSESENTNFFAVEPQKNGKMVSPFSESEDQSQIPRVRKSHTIKY